MRSITAVSSLPGSLTSRRSDLSLEHLCVHDEYARRQLLLPLCAGRPGSSVLGLICQSKDDSANAIAPFRPRRHVALGHPALVLVRGGPSGDANIDWGGLGRWAFLEVTDPWDAEHLIREKYLEPAPVPL